MQLATFFLQTVMLTFTAFICSFLSLATSLHYVEGQLEIVKLTKWLVDVVYEDALTGSGLRITSAPDSMHLRTLDGRNLVLAQGAEGSLRLIVVGQRAFVQFTANNGESSDFVMLDAYSDAIYNNDVIDMKSFLQDFMLAAKISGIEEDNGEELQKALKNLTMIHPKMEQHLQSVVSILSGRGVTGLEYPSVLPFYMTTFKLNQFLGNLSEVASGFDSGAPLRLRRDELQCLSECPPCQDQECLGMCGYGCQCWECVCGDCCFHSGCYKHDILCREKFFQTCCLFPFSFSCD